MHESASEEWVPVNPGRDWALRTRGTGGRRWLRGSYRNAAADGFGDAFVDEPPREFRAHHCDYYALQQGRQPGPGARLAGQLAGPHTRFPWPRSRVIRTCYCSGCGPTARAIPCPGLVGCCAVNRQIIWFWLRFRETDGRRSRRRATSSSCGGRLPGDVLTGVADLPPPRSGIRDGCARGT